ncbi:MAG: N-acetylglucosamine-6-phosphate deacetylase [Thermoguttaceae bacterium]|jgi:N-acetylglucosamine-6-phosphate deacetylase
MEYIAKRYDTGRPVKIIVKGTKVQSVESVPSGDDLPIVGPGLFDIQINGGLGYDFSSESITVEQAAAVFRQVIGTGVFRFCPTMITNSAEAYRHGVTTLMELLETFTEFHSVMVGIHLEGPFIANETGPRGSHPPKHCVPYNFELIEELQRISGGRIRIVTLSPTYDGAEDFISRLNALGILVATGHTNATPNEISQAAAAGARLATHLGNASHSNFPKWGNYFFAQLTDDRLTASMIADGFHLSPMMMRTILRTKGLDRTILISDQADVAGCPPGKYKSGPCALEVLENGKIALAADNDLLAGGSYPVARGLCNVMAVADLNLAEAYPLCTTQPAALLGEPAFSNGDQRDFLAVGKPADFLIFRQEPSRLGPLGLSDSDNFTVGRFHFEKIVRRGKEADIFK